MASSSSWPCSRCTFLNPPTQKSTCQVCLSPSIATLPSPSSPSLSLQWSCRACTFSNPITIYSCEMCGTASAASDTDDGVLDPSVGSVFMPLRRCSTTVTKSKRAVGDEDVRVKESGSSSRPEKMVKKDVVEDSSVSGYADLDVKHNVLKVLSYNVWFREDLELHKRMKALGDLIQQHCPDFIFFQEVTSNIYEIFQKANWWKDYKCSVSPRMAAERPYFCMQMSKLPVEEFTCKPFHNSIMGRELCVADIDVGMGKMLKLATSHLESPCPAPPRWDQMFTPERVAQAKESLRLLKDSPNVIFGGDMNWDDKLDGPFPLQEGWVDPWMELHPEENGWTFDTKANQMLSGNRTLQKRLDRFVCKLQDFKIASIDMIGQDAIPGISYVKEKKVKNQIRKLVLPVLPSDHYGLLLTIHGL